MSDASLSNLLTIFNNVLWSFQYIILPICFVLGNIGNCFNLLIFCRPSSRANSCLLYFMSASIINIFILNFGLVLRILRGIWNIDPAIQFLWFCRWRTYLTSSFFLIYRCSILLACIDRMCASSSSAWVRLESRPQIASRLIIISWLVCFIWYIPSLVFMVIAYGQCLAPPGTIYATYATVSTLVQGWSIPLAMIVCGLITFRHLKQMQTRVGPVTIAVRDERRVAGQFIVMLFVQVGVDCLCNLIYQVYLIFSLIFSPPQSAQITAISSFLISMSFNVPYLNYSAGFYMYTLSSPSFRRKFLRLVKRIGWLRRHLPFDHERHNTLSVALTNMRHRHTTAIDPPSNH